MLSLKTVLIAQTVIHTILHLRQALNYITIGHIYMPPALYPLDMLMHYLVYLIPSYYLIFDLRAPSRGINMLVFASTTILYLALCYLGLGMVANYKTENGYYPLSYLLTTIIHAHVLSMIAQRLWVFIAYFGVAYSYMAIWTEILGVSYATFMEPNHFIELLIACGLSFLIYQEHSSARKSSHFD